MRGDGYSRRSRRWRHVASLPWQGLLRDISRARGGVRVMQVKGIDGISQVETQTYTLMPVE